MKACSAAAALLALVLFTALAERTAAQGSCGELTGDDWCTACELHPESQPDFSVYRCTECREGVPIIDDPDLTDAGQWCDTSGLQPLPCAVRETCALDPVTQRELCNQEDPTKCASCLAGYQLVNGDCVQACTATQTAAGCAACKLGRCSSCKAGYSFVEMGSKCVKCSVEHCASCADSDPLWCDQCEDGFFPAFDAATNSPVCAECEPWLGFKPFKEGGQCVCDPAMGMTSNGEGDCVPSCVAIPGCKSCQDEEPTQCQACDTEAGYRREPADGECLCDAGAGFFSDGTGCVEACDPIPGCVQGTCNAGVGRCAACAAAAGFKATPVDGECECDAAAGYVADGAGCTKQQPDCTATIAGCKTCLTTDRTRCATCDTAADFKPTPVGGQCECATGYELQDGNCVAKPPEPTNTCDSNCADCDATTGTCRRCSAGYGPDGANKAVCMRCTVASCSDCFADARRCDKCAGTKQLQNNQCVDPAEPVDPTADECLAAVSRCVECAPEPNSQLCSRCEDGYEPDEASTECLPREPTACTSIDRCSICSSPDACDQCEDGWQLSGAGCKRAAGTLCTDTDPGCAACDPDNACLRCKTGWELNRSTKRCERPGLTPVDPPSGPRRCQQRDPECAAFEPDCRCRRCRLSTWVVEKGSGRCRATKPTSACARKFPNCQRCNSKLTTCKACSAGHDWSWAQRACRPKPAPRPSTCARKFPNCLRCNAKRTACTSCASGYQWSASKRACLKPAPKPISACARKFPRCRRCNSKLTACTSCASGTSWSAAKRACAASASKPRPFYQ